MKDLNLMFNVSDPSVYHIVEAGKSVTIDLPGTYNVVPINLDKIIAGYAAPLPPLQEPETPSLLDLAINENDKPVTNNTLDTKIDTKIEPLFTRNLSDLLYLTRAQ